MKHSIFSLALAAAVLVAGPLAHATLIHFEFHLSPANEVPPTASTGTGVVDLELDTIAQTLGGQIVFSGLTTNTTAAHIHCCLASPFQTGVNVGVATVVPAFPGFPLGVTSGTDNFLLDLSLASSYNPAFITLQGGLANAEASFINGLIAGETYLNIHTVYRRRNPGLRGGSGAVLIGVARDSGARARWFWKSSQPARIVPAGLKGSTGATTFAVVAAMIGIAVCVCSAGSLARQATRRPGVGAVR